MTDLLLASTDFNEHEPIFERQREITEERKKREVSGRRATLKARIVHLKRAIEQEQKEKKDLTAAMARKNLELREIRWDNNKRRKDMGYDIPG